MSDYVPMGVRQGESDPGALRKDVPPWLRQSLIEWMDNALKVPKGGNWGGGIEYETSRERLRKIERICQLELDWAHDRFSARTSLASQASSGGDHRKFFWAIDYLCSLGRDQLADIDELDSILREGGSAWRVSRVNGPPHLEERVPEGVVEAAEAAMAHGEAGRILGEAWRELYGLKPDESEAYGHAIKAIETAAHAIIEPNNAKATLGTMIKTMKTNPSRWDVKTEGAHPVETLISMMETVWSGQTNRHGARGGVRELVEGAAAVAVAMAVTLVAVFEQGLVETV